MQNITSIDSDVAQDYFSLQPSYSSNSYTSTPTTPVEAAMYRPYTPIGTSIDSRNYGAFTPTTPIAPINFSFSHANPTDTIELLKSLQKKDAIFEPNVIDLVKRLVDNSLEYIPEIYKSLCHSYTGEPSKIQLVSDLYDEFVSENVQPRAEIVCREALKKMVKEKYDSTKIDEVEKSMEEVFNPVLPLIQQQYWRNTIYALSEKYPDSSFLNILIQRIADQGHFSEIKHLKTASTFIEVYSKVLLDQLKTIIEVDEAGVQKLLPDLIRTASLHPHSYLFVQALVKRLSQEQNGYPLRKLAKELEKGVNKLGGSELIPNLRSLIAAPPNVIATSILYIPPTPGDVVAQYQKDPPPSPIYLRDPELLYWLLTNVFVPSEQNKNIKLDLKEKYLYLAAFASSAKEIPDGNVDISKVNSTFDTLKKLSATLSKKSATGSEFNSIVPDLLVYIDTPIASMASIFWIKYLLRETSFYEKNFKFNEVPIPHLILEEIAFRHPYQRGHVFNAYKADLESSHKLTPEVMTALKKQLLDRMIFLISIGYVMQVLKMVSPPYSAEFYGTMLRLIEPIYVVLEAGLETRPLIQKFLTDCPILEEKRAQEAVDRTGITGKIFTCDVTLQIKALNKMGTLKYFKECDD
ncbi:2236_t:CDS:10 [Diversispora eburnea]|uniref:2236_t:CDS:1 n=1 Tax=Diversispora eburnea TaxID=1213867 RepID=A0A9N8WM06_9GLOM|nr:2236_t:CDS:10 [Diversispora eburnea]